MQNDPRYHQPPQHAPPQVHAPYVPPQVHVTQVNRTSYRGMRRFPHLWHLILTCCTCGLWFPVWVMHYLLRELRGD